MDRSLTLRSLLARPRLDAAREHRLATLTRVGDQVARRELIEGSLPLVALRVAALGLPADRVDDALQDGVLGLIAAIDRFNPDRGARLASYAWSWIEGAIRRGALADECTAELVDDPADPTPADDAAVDRQALGQLLARLSPQDREVVTRRFGLGTTAGLGESRRVVSADLGRPLESIRSAELRAMRHLRAGLATVGDRASETRPILHSSIGRAFDC